MLRSTPRRLDGGSADRGGMDTVVEAESSIDKAASKDALAGGLDWTTTVGSGIVPTTWVHGAEIDATENLALGITEEEDDDGKGHAELALPAADIPISPDEPAAASAESSGAMF